MQANEPEAWEKVLWFELCCNWQQKKPSDFQCVPLIFFRINMDHRGRALQASAKFNVKYIKRKLWCGPFDIAVCSYEAPSLIHNLVDSLSACLCLSLYSFVSVYLSDSLNWTTTDYGVEKFHHMWCASCRMKHAVFRIDLSVTRRVTVKCGNIFKRYIRFTQERIFKIILQNLNPLTH